MYYHSPSWAENKKGQGGRLWFSLPFLRIKFQEEQAMIRIAICEDERPVGELLHAWLSEWKKELCISRFTSAGELLTEGAFDLYFLDIGLSGEMNGMELARALRGKWGREALIIFVTGHEEYVYEAFDVEAFAYLLKPVERERLRAVCERAYARITERETAPQCFTVRVGTAVREIRIDGLSYVEGAGHKMIMHMHNENLECYAKMGELEKLLCERFFRIHKGYLVNLSEVEAYDRTEVTLVGGARLPLSRYKYDAFAKAYLHFLRGRGSVG